MPRFSSVSVVGWRASRYLVRVMMRWLSQALHGKEIQGRTCQKGRDGGVHTHHDFGGAERQSTFYLSALLARE